MKATIWKIIKGIRYLLIVALLCILITKWFIDVPHFKHPTSTVLEARDGSLLSARIASDGQWRFPVMDSVPQNFKTCILHFEDRRFYVHPGVDPIGVLRAARVNLKAGKVVQGGSTITMQIARMLNGGQERTFINKFEELLLAFHLEINQTKEELLATYASNAPFGGNVVGLEAASWRYFGRDPWSLSWAESAVLAVLPNAPSLIYPGRSQERLLIKRNKLLKSLLEKGGLSEEEYELAVLEELPRRPIPMPSNSLHLMESYMSSQEGKRIRTSIDPNLQAEAQELLNKHVQGLGSIEVYNGALIILNTRTQDILAYIGNSNYTREHGNWVDCARAPRSSGSILKPILYAEMIDQGELTPSMLIPDIPSRFSEYSPENYSGGYDGSVRADEALYRSLNIPFVRLLKRYGVARFQKDLQEKGLSSVSRSPSDYGLSLMLGGAEVRLDELTRLYARMGASLEGADGDYLIHKWSVYHTFHTMKRLTRPEGREFQRSFSSSRKVAWKTGTSFGHKDAWAIGITPDYTVGVWVGNADGEGRNGLTGVGSAAPVLFDALDILPTGDWYSPPMEPGYLVEVCQKSGHIAGRNCPESEVVELPAPDYTAVGACPYHRLVYETEDGKWQGRQGCSSSEVLIPKKYFILPPVQELYYKISHADYRTLPPMLPNCELNGGEMEFIYPQAGQKVYIPKDMDGSSSRVICKLAHRVSEKEVYWYLDQVYLGSSRGVHELQIYCNAGIHQLMAVDEGGEEISIDFEVLSDSY